jgi:hypothetical protein
MALILIAVLQPVKYSRLKSECSNIVKNNFFSMWVKIFQYICDNVTIPKIKSAKVKILKVFSI